MHLCKRFASRALQVFDQLDADLKVVDAIPDQPVKRRSPPSVSEAKTIARDAFDAFADACPLDDVRLQEICSAARPFRETSERLMPTSLVTKAHVVKGMQLIDMNCPKVRRQAVALCNSQELTFPPKRMLKTGVHYAKYRGKTMISLLSITQMKLNRTPGSLAISVDIAASIDEEHSMSMAIGSLQNMLSKRRNPCVLFAQVANTESARRFWQVKPA